MRHVRHRGLSAVVEDPDDVGLVVDLTSAHRVEGNMAGYPTSSSPTIGAVTVMTPGRRFEFTIVGACSAINVRLPWLLLQRAACEIDVGLSKSALVPVLHSRDPALSKLVYAVAAASEIEQKTHLDRLARCVVTRICPQRAMPKRCQGGLSPFVLARSLAFIEQRVADKLSVAAIAEAVGLSPSHFARLFAKEMGFPPRQYIIRRRVERAINLLGTTKLGIAAIADDCGFAQRSHLALAMGGMTGLSPSAFRRHVLP